MIDIITRETVRAPGLKTRILRRMGSLFFPEFDALIDRRNNVLAVLSRPGGIKEVIPGRNIVTDAGDEYYAELGAGEAATNAFGVLVLATAGTPAKAADIDDFTTIAASEKAHDAAYPQTDDQDADNTGTTGVDVVSFLTSYTKADFSAAGITHGVITNAAPAAAEPILTGYAFAAAFEKTANDTLKVFTNHEFSGQ